MNPPVAFNLRQLMRATLAGRPPKKRPAPRAYPILVLYADLAAGRNAMALISRLARQHATVRPEPMLWRFDQLADPRRCATAVHDAAKAEIIIVAISAATGVPDTIDSCLTRIVNQRSQAATTVIVAANDDVWTIAVERTAPVAAAGPVPFPTSLPASPSPRPAVELVPLARAG